MSWRLGPFVVASLVGVFVVSTLWAQVPQQGQGNRTTSNGKGGKGKPKDEVKLDDPRLIEVHKQFVTSVEKLAGEYEKTNQLEKARQCYEQVLRLIPQYKPAEDKLGQIREREATAETRRVEVFANKDWQDSGVTVGEGKPCSIKAAGKWKFQMQYELTPDGIEIPKELRDFNIGALVGRIVTGSGDDRDGKVFFVGSGTSFNAREDGRLQLRIYDSDVTDNSGKIQVEITGSFEKKSGVAP